MQRDTMKINLFKLHPTVFKIRHLLFHDSLKNESPIIQKIQYPLIDPIFQRARLPENLSPIN